MKFIYYLTLFFLGATIATNIYFLFHINLYPSDFGIALSICTSVSLIGFLAIIILRKRRLKKRLNAEYDKVFSRPSTRLL